MPSADVTIPKLPPPCELIEHARASRTGHSPPVAFEETRGQLEYHDAQRELAARGLHELIRDSYKLGVPMSVLARWSGYSARHVQQILGKP